MKKAKLELSKNTEKNELTGGAGSEHYTHRELLVRRRRRREQLSLGAVLNPLSLGRDQSTCAQTRGPRRRRDRLSNFDVLETWCV